MATGYLAGAVVPLCWTLEQLHGGIAWWICFGMGVCSPAKSLVRWAEAWLWTVPVSGQVLLKQRTGIFCWVAFTNHRVSIADLHFTFARPVWVPCVLPWPRQEMDVGRS